MIFKALVFLFLIYNVKFILLGGIGTSYIMLLYLIVVTLLFGKLINLSRIALICASFLCLLSILMFSLLYPLVDFGLIKFSIIAITSIVISGSVFKKYFGSEPIELFGVFGLAGFINAIIIIMMLVSSSFQDIYLSFLIVEAEELFGESISDGFFALRMVGLTGFATYSTAFTQCICLFSYYIYTSHKSKEEKSNVKASNYIVMIVILLSAVIAARTAFIGFVILFAMMMFDSDNRKRNLIFLLACVMLFIGLLSIAAMYFPSENTDFFINWVTEIFNKGLEVGSVQKMGDMFHFSYYDFSILGESRLNSSSGGYYMGVDIGYLRVLFSAGYFGTLLIALSFITSVRIDKIEMIYVVYTMFLFLLISVFMVKGLIIFDAFYILLYVSLVGHAFRALSLNKKKRVYVEA